MSKLTQPTCFQASKKVTNLNLHLIGACVRLAALLAYVRDVANIINRVVCLSSSPAPTARPDRHLLLCQRRAICICVYVLVCYMHGLSLCSLFSPNRPTYHLCLRSSFVLRVPSRDVGVCPRQAASISARLCVYSLAINCQCNTAVDLAGFKKC